MPSKTTFIFTIASLVFAACNTSRNAFYHEEEKGWQSQSLPHDSLLAQTLFLVGDVGDAKLKRENPVLPMLGRHLAEAGKNSAVAFLGDNIPKVDWGNEAARAKAEASLNSQLEILKGFEGKVFFLPGDQDWNRGRKDGLEAVRWQENYVEERLQNEEVFLPTNGCGDPETVKLEDDVVLLFVNSPWWLQDWRPFEDINSGCEVKDRLAFLQEMRDILKKNNNEFVVVLSHHPLFSNGNHGGSFSLKNHLFPFTTSSRHLYLPAPGIGTLAMLARQTGANSQDIPHSHYLRMRNEMMELLELSPRNRNVVFAAGHDHSLQYFNKLDGRAQFIVSGSGGRKDYARGGKTAGFVQAERGFTKLLFYKNRQVWVEFWTVDDGGSPLGAGGIDGAGSPSELVPKTREAGGGGKLAFRKRLFQGEPPSPETPAIVTAKPLPDSVASIASDQYKTGIFWRTFFGRGYRKAWQTSVTAPVFNMNDAEFSQLEPVQQGGSMSSKNLRLEMPDGKQYVLRSVKKNILPAVKKEWRWSALHKFYQELKSSSHPYASLAVPPLADAAGVYHSNPRLFFVPPQPGLKNYSEGFGGELYFFEERPDDDWSDEPSFGNSSKIIGFTKLLDNLQDDPKHRVDQRWTLNSRLFDQWMNDFDRHDDQWRWASFVQTDSTILYRPIPRDRDAAFADLRGAVPFVASRRWLRQMQRGLRERIYDVPGQAKIAIKFDRSFLNELDYKDWMAAAKSLQTKLTDAEIENAFRAFPPEVQALDAPRLVKTLKARRERIPRHAEKLYRYLARYVDVVGTNEKELFQVNRLENGDAEVMVFALDKNGNRKDTTYHRLFRKKETREIRLYGLGKDDQFYLTGKAQKAILVRIIGGTGEDRVTDDSKVRGGSKHTVVYDKPGSLEFEGDEVKDQRSDDLKVNDYNRLEYRYDSYFPMLSFGRTEDDGLFLGGGLTVDLYGFRKYPYGVRHRINGDFSTRNNAFHLNYEADFTKAFGWLNFNPTVSFDRPIIFNFYGYGNGSTDPQGVPDRFHWVRLEKLSVRPLLKRNWYNGRNFTRLGPFFERIEVENRPGRITDTELFPQQDFGEKNFAGFLLNHEYNSLDHQRLPKNGLKWGIGATFYQDLDSPRSYLRLEGSLTTFFTLPKPLEITFGTRFGAATLTSNDFLFYHSNNLGGNAYLRGFHNNRFAGRTIVFHNTDLRIRLFRVRNQVVPFIFGISGGFDYGRVWHDEVADPKVWHSGISPGVWFSAFDISALSAFYTFTNGMEEDTYTVRLGYFF